MIAKAPSESNQVARGVAILGAESSGKTELTQQLAEHYNADAVYEFARTYMTSSTVTKAQLEHIARQQFETENQMMATSKSEYIFFDTEMINLKVWFEYVYKKAPQWLADLDLQERYDLYLLTSNDLPWQPDTLRNMPEQAQRDQLRECYLSEIKDSQVPYALVQGLGKQRLQTAIDAINLHFSH